MDLQPLNRTLPVSSVESFLKKARMVQKRLSTDEMKVKLQSAQQAAARCLGYWNLRALQQSAKLGMWPAFEDELDVTKSRQHLREIAVLTDFLPHLTRNVIEEFVDGWRLVNWSLVESTGVEVVTNEQSPSLPSTKEALSPAVRAPSFAIYQPSNVDMSSWVVPEALEIFMPPALAFASEKAKALPQILPTVTDDIAHAVIARVYGFASWWDLEQKFRLASRSKFDEELEGGNLRVRTKWQCAMLQGCLQISRTEASLLRIDWKPTSQSVEYRNVQYHEPAADSGAFVENRSRISGRLTLKRQSA